MADDMLIGVGVKADFSTLKSEAKASAEALKQAQAEWDSAFQELGKAAEQGSGQAIAALKEYETALDLAVARDRAAKDAIAANERAAHEKRIQQQRDYQEYLQRTKAAAIEEAAASELAARAAGHTVAPMAAASGALRELSGNFEHNIRAAERFIGTSLGLGPILQAAFPLVGALAFAGVIVEMGKSLYNAFDLGGERARAAAEAIEHDTSSMKLLNHELNVEVDKLELANAKLEHRPANGMKLTIDEAALAVDKLNEKLDGSLKRIEGTLKAMAGGTLQQMFGTKGGTDYEQTMVREHARRLSEAKTQQDQLNESVSYGLSLQTRLQEMRDHAAKGDLSPATIASFDTTEIPAVQHMIEMQQQEQAAIKTTMEVQKAESRHTADERIRDEERAAEKAKKAWGETVSRMIKDNEFRAKDAERVTNEVQAFGISTLKQEEAEQNRAAEAEKGQLQESKRQYEEKLRILQDIGRAKMADATSEIDQRMNEVRGESAQGMLNPQREAQELTDLVNQKIQIENSYYQQLESMYVRDSLQWQQIEDQRLSAMRKNAAEMAKIAQDAANKEMRSYQQVARTINRELIGAMDQILMGQTSIARGAEQMAGRMILSFINAMAEQVLEHAAAKEIMLAHEAAHWIAVNILHMSSTATQAATDATANATKLTETITSNVAQAASYAAVAGAAGLASTAAIPVVGPFMAPGVAAALYATGLGFTGLASAAGGWDQIPHDQIAQVHKDEMVLSAPIAGLIRGMANNGASRRGSGGGMSLHYNPVINGAGNEKQMKRVVKESSREVGAALRKYVRNNGFGG